MTFRGFRSRADLGLRSPRSRSTRIEPDRGGTAKHYGGPPTGLGLSTPHERCEATWRSWQDFHMDTHGWVDIAYSFGFCQHGYALAGRGLGVRTAANGTDDANGRFYAACWLGGQGEQPTRDALDALDEIVRVVRASGAGVAVEPHSHFKSTACPGPALRTYVPSTKTPAPPEDDMPEFKDRPDRLPTSVDNLRPNDAPPSLGEGIGYAYGAYLLASEIRDLMRTSLERQSSGTDAILQAVKDAAKAQGADPDAMAADVAARLKVVVSQ